METVKIMKGIDKISSEELFTKMVGPVATTGK